MPSRQAQKSPPGVAAAQGALKGVAVGVDEAGHGESAGHAPYPCQRALSRAQLPNALTIARLAADPGLRRADPDVRRRPFVAGALVFGVAGVTDQIDGFLARRWHVESAFGKIADPLADRLMIDTAVILLCLRRPAALGRAR